MVIGMAQSSSIWFYLIFIRRQVMKAMEHHRCIKKEEQLFELLIKSMKTSDNTAYLVISLFVLEASGTKIHIFICRCPPSPS